MHILHTRYKQYGYYSQSIGIYFILTISIFGGVIVIKRLRQLRESKNLTQLRLAMELNVSQETISGYEIGKAVPPAEMLVKLADALDTSVDYLLGRTDIKSALRASELSEEEADMLTILRKQPQDKRDFIFKLIRGLD